MIFSSAFIFFLYCTSSSIFIEEIDFIKFVVLSKVKDGIINSESYGLTNYQLNTKSLLYLRQLKPKLSQLILVNIFLYLSFIK